MKTVREGEREGQGDISTTLDLLAAGRAPLPRAAVDLPRARSVHTRRNLLLVVGGGAALVAIAFGLRQLKAAAPTVDRANLWVDDVHRGPLVREVLGQGSLVPEQVQWIAAKTNARVERILVKPGTRVEPDTVILQLSNSDLELQALESARQLAQGEAELVNLQATLSGQKLAQESVIASLRSELADADRRARADEELAKKGFLSDLELGQTRGRAAELGGRLRFEQGRATAQSRGMAAQVQAQQAQIERLRSIAEFRRKEVEELSVRAGVAGALQVLALQPGEAVSAGAVLAKIADPAHLKAEIRIPETEAKDVRVGQKASIDTHNGTVPGQIVRIDPVAKSGTVLVDVAVAGALPSGARPDLSVEGTIEIERLPSALYVSRPALAQPGETIGLFKLDANGRTAVRTAVKLGRTSVKNVEIVSGLDEGDRVVLSDMSQWDRVDSIRLR